MRRLSAGTYGSKTMQSTDDALVLFRHSVADHRSLCAPETEKAAET